MVGDTLKPEQTRRLKQICYQMHAPQAVTQMEVMSAMIHTGTTTEGKANSRNYLQATEEHVRPARIATKASKKRWKSSSRPGIRFGT